MASAERRARRRPGVDRPLVPAATARRWPVRRDRAGSLDAAAPSAPGGAGEHARRPQRHLLHAVFLHSFHHHRLAAGLVQGSRVSLPCGTRIPYRAEGDGTRIAAADRDPCVGHDGRYTLHGAAAAAAAHGGLAGTETGGCRDARFDDRRRATVTGGHRWTAFTTR